MYWGNAALPKNCSTNKQNKSLVQDQDQAEHEKQRLKLQSSLYPASQIDHLRSSLSWTLAAAELWTSPPLSSVQKTKKMNSTQPILYLAWENSHAIHTTFRREGLTAAICSKNWPQSTLSSDGKRNPEPAVKLLNCDALVHAYMQGAIWYDKT